MSVSGHSAYKYHRVCRGENTEYRGWLSIISRLVVELAELEVIPIGSQPSRPFGGGVCGFRAKATDQMLGYLHMIVSGKARAAAMVLRV